LDLLFIFVSLSDYLMTLPNPDEDAPDDWFDRQHQYGEAARPLFEKERQRIAEDVLQVPDEEDEDLKRARSSYSIYRMLIEDVTKAASEYAIANDITVGDFEWEAVSPGVNVVNRLQSALIEDWSKTELIDRWRFWHHERNPLRLIKKDKAPYMMRNIVEEAATEYLDLPYRVPLLERIIVDVLVALELYAFGKEMFGPSGLPWWFPKQSPFHQYHAVVGYLGSQLVNAIVLIGLALLIGNYGSWLVGETVANWIAGGLVLLFVLGLGLSTIGLPFAWRNQSRARKKIATQIEAMAKVYAELNTDGIISARRIQDAATHAANLGVVWPPPLFAVLDDIISRKGRF
jgi:hypothetical protein